MTDRLKPLSRREFLKLGGLGMWMLAPRSLKRILAPSPLPSIEPTKGWEIPSIEKQKLLLADPNFFLKPQDSSGRIILTPQFADSEWDRLTDRTYFDSCSYKAFGCGASIIATIVKTMGYFHDGKVPDVTDADVINFLMDKNHDGYKMILPKNIEMHDDPLKWSIELFGQKKLSTVRITRDWGLDNSHIVPESEWAGLFRFARKNVLDKGGLVIARVLKWGDPKGSMGHYIIISSFNAGGEPLIVDSIAIDKQGSARTVALSTYVERVPEDVPVLKGQRGLLWMAGVVPTF